MSTEVAPAPRGADGMRWQALVTVAAQAAQALASFVVAAVTSPHEFALWGIAGVFFNVQFLVGSLGLGQALIYQRHGAERTQAAVDAAAALTTGLAVALGVLGFALAGALPGLLGSGFSDGDVADVVRVMSVVLLFSVAANVPQALIERELDFRRRARPDLASTALYLLVVGLGLALGWGVWSLMWGRLAQAVGAALLFWAAAPVRPRMPPRVERAMVAELFGYGKWVIAAGVVGFVTANTDTLAVGAASTATALGAYALAFTVTNLAPTFLSQTLGKVFFPLYAAVREDRVALRAAVAEALGYLTALMLPVTAGLVLFGAPALPALFGREWAPAEPLVRILALYGLARTVGAAANVLQTGVGRADAALRNALLVLAASLIALVPLAAHDAAGVAWAFTIGQVVGAAVAWWRLGDVWSRADLGAVRAPVLAVAPAVGAGLVTAAAVGDVAAGAVFALVHAGVWWAAR